MVDKILPQGSNENFCNCKQLRTSFMRETTLTCLETLRITRQAILMLNQLRKLSSRIPDHRERQLKPINFAIDDDLDYNKDLTMDELVRALEERPRPR